MSTAATDTGESARAERRRVAQRVTLVGSVLDAVLGVLKIGVGLAAHSQALIADGVHSLSDLATDGLVLIAARHAHAEPDDEHPYGHERIETVATVVLGLSLVAVGAAIGIDAVRRMLHPELLMHPEIWALPVAVLSIVAKEWVFRYTVSAAKRLRSKLLEANAWHSRSDALSSVVVAAALLGTMAGLDYVDAVAAVVVGWMVARVGWRFAYSSFRELIDTGLDDEELQVINDTIMAVPGVHSLHELRTRRMGSRALVDVHILLADPHVSVSEGHQISELVRARLMRGLRDVSDVMVHIDPEDDEDEAPGVHLPMRAEFIEHLERKWAAIPDLPPLDSCTLHYLHGRIDVDLYLQPGAVADPDQLASRLRAASSGDATIGQVRVMVAHAP